MASCNLSSLSHRFHFISKTPFSPSTPRTKTLTLIPRISNVHHSTSRTAIQTHIFTWDDVLRIPQTDENPASDLRGYFDKVRLCNRGSEMKSEFVPFVVEAQIAGYVHNRFMDHLRKFHDVFTFPQNNNNAGHSGGSIMLHPSLRSPENRTAAVGDVIKVFGEELVPAIPCDIIIRNANLFLTGTCCSTLLWHKVSFVIAASWDLLQRESFEGM